MLDGVQQAPGREDIARTVGLLLKAGCTRSPAATAQAVTLGWISVYELCSDSRAARFSRSVSLQT